MADSTGDSDEALMARVKRGDQAAFAVLVRRHTNMFFGAAYRMCNEKQAAEDIVQEAFLKLWQKPENWDPARGVKFTTWFYRVVTNLAIDQGRKRKHSPSSPEIMATVPDNRPGAEESMDENRKEEALEQAIQGLPEKQKTALNLCFYEGLSNREAAEIMGLGVKALESLLMRAKAALKEDLARKGLLEKNVYSVRRSHAG